MDSRETFTMDSGTVYGPWPTRNVVPGGEISTCAVPTPGGRRRLQCGRRRRRWRSCRAAPRAAAAPPLVAVAAAPSGGGGGSRLRRLTRRSAWRVRLTRLRLLRHDNESRHRRRAGRRGERGAGRCLRRIRRRAGTRGRRPRRGGGRRRRRGQRVGSGRDRDQRRRSAETDVLLRSDVDRPEIVFGDLTGPDDVRRQEHDQVDLALGAAVERERLLQQRHVNRAGKARA